MKIKKSFSILIFAILLVIMISLVPSKSVKATTSDVDLLICNPGEDSSTQMNFSFHTTVKGVVVEIAKKSDGNFDNAIKVTPTYMSYADAYPFVGKTSYSVIYGAETDNVSICEASASGLEPDTEYMYRVGATNFSETRYFKTASNDGSFSFILTADPQIYGGQTGSAFKTTNDTMERALAKAKSLGMNPELLLSAGDEVNDGNEMNSWRDLYSLDIYKQMTHAACIGNHDVLGVPAENRPNVFSSLKNNPKNGLNDFDDTTYYFKWNNVLFVVMNTEVFYDTSLFNAQIKWFENVVETVPHQYIIVMYHRACWGGSTEPAKYWYETFEKYNIDLSFSGDNHDYGRGSTNVGAERGQKNFPNNYIVCDDTRNAANGDKVNLGGYCLFNVTPKGITLYTYDQNDQMIDYCNFSAQRSMPSSDGFDKTSFMNNLNIECKDTDPTKAILSWNGEGFENNVGHITVYNQNGAEVKDVYANSINETSAEFGGLKSGESYTYKVKVEFKDGTTESKEIAFETKVNYGTYSSIELKELSSTYRLIFNPDDIKNKLLEKVNVYIDGTLRGEYSANAKFVAIDKGYIAETYLIELKGVSKFDQSEVLIGKISKGVASDPDLKIITTDFEIEVGSSSAKVNATCENGGKILYTSSDESIITVNENGYITALKAGNAKIIVSVEGYDVKKEINVTVKEKASEEPSKLDKPVIKLEENTLTINNVNGATSYEIYIDGDLKEIVTNLTIDLSKYNLGEGSYKVKVKAKGENTESEFSNEITFVVSNEEPTPTPEPVESGCNSGSIQAIWYVVSILGLAVVFKKKRF